MRRKIDEATAKSRASAVRIVPDDALTGWEHDEENMERVSSETSRDYCPGVAVYPPPEPEHPFILEPTPLVTTSDGDGEDIMPQVGHSTGMPSQPASTEDYTATEAATIRRILLDAGVLNSNDGVTKIAEMHGFVRCSAR